MRSIWILWLGACLCLPAAAATFRVASYNLENYLLEPAGDRPVKSEAARAKIREALLQIRPDVLALQEMGPLPALRELQESLRHAGLDLPHAEHVTGADTNIHLALLSRFPITDRRSRTDDRFLVGRRPYRVSRGFLEVDLKLPSGYELTVVNVHLKSRRPSPDADEAEIRRQEAVLLRQQVDALLRSRPERNLVVAGDFNDLPNSDPVQVVLGKGALRLVDLRPAERNGDAAPPEGRFPPRRVTWTHYFGRDETYSRADYLLVSRALQKEWEQGGAWVHAFADWGVASDHRPVVAEFSDRDR